MEEEQVWSLGWEDPLEEVMATRSSIFAWRIPRTKELSIGLQRVRHDRSDLACMPKYRFNSQSALLNSPLVRKASSIVWVPYSPLLLFQTQDSLLLFAVIEHRQRVWSFWRLFHLSWNPYQFGTLVTEEDQGSPSKTSIGMIVIVPQ